MKGHRGHPSANIWPGSLSNYPSHTAWPSARHPHHPSAPLVTQVVGQMRQQAAGRIMAGSYLNMYDVNTALEVLTTGEGRGRKFLMGQKGFQRTSPVR